MKRIPIKTAKRVAEDYGYDQVIIVARKVASGGDEGGEHVTTYGVNRQHCSIASYIGDYLKHNIMGWPKYNENAKDRPTAEMDV